MTPQYFRAIKNRFERNMVTNQDIAILISHVEHLSNCIQELVNDFAQDVVEDPCGSMDREVEGFARISVHQLRRCAGAIGASTSLRVEK